MQGRLHAHPQSDKLERKANFKKCICLKHLKHRLRNNTVQPNRASPEPSSRSWPVLMPQTAQPGHRPRAVQGTAARPPRAAGPCPAASLHGPAPAHRAPAPAALHEAATARPGARGSTALPPGGLGTQRRGHSTINQARAQPAGRSPPEPGAARPRGAGEARRPRPAPAPLTHEGAEGHDAQEPLQEDAEAVHESPVLAAAVSRPRRRPPARLRGALGEAKAAVGPRRPHGEARPAPASAAHGGGGDVATGGRGRAPPPASSPSRPPRRVTARAALPLAGPGPAEPLRVCPSVCPGTAGRGAGEAREVSGCVPWAARPPGQTNTEPRTCSPTRKAFP